MKDANGDDLARFDLVKIAGDDDLWVVGGDDQLGGVRVTNTRTNFTLSRAAVHLVKQCPAKS